VLHYFMEFALMRDTVLSIRREDRPQEELLVPCIGSRVSRADALFSFPNVKLQMEDVATSIH
jgi:hypothetical protein